MCVDGSNCLKVLVVFLSQDNKQNILPAAWWQPVHPALPRGTVEEWRPREDQLRTGRRLKRSVCFPGRLQLITVWCRLDEHNRQRKPIRGWGGRQLLITVTYYITRLLPWKVNWYVTVLEYFTVHPLRRIWRRVANSGCFHFAAIL